MPKLDKITRNYPELLDFLKNHESILVLGPRGTGKTYFLSRLIAPFSNKIELDFFHEATFERYLKRPSLISEEIRRQANASEEPVYVFIDEIQRLPVILNEIQGLIESLKPKVTFILTGSSARKLKREEANLLAGRALKIDFFPLGLDEINLDENLDRVLQFGTLPKAYTEKNKTILSAYLRTYVSAYLKEEIQRESQIRNLEGFAKFLDLAAAENAQTLNFLKMARAASISDVAARSYYEILEDTLIAYRIPAWSYSQKEQLQQSPKYYFFDNGVLNALSGELESELRQSTYRYGKLFENLVVTQLIQAKTKRHLPVNIFHYRNAQGKEIDLILQKNPFSPPVAVEIKSSTAPTLQDIPKLRVFGSSYENSKSVVICRTPRSYQLENVLFLPLEEGINKVLEMAVNF